MLIQFTVENFLSFKNKVVFSMLASDEQRHPEQVCTLADGRRLVRCATVYGANASGKSNLVKALEFAQDLITDGTRPGSRIRVKPFKLPLGSSQEVRFEFEIWIENYRYSYGFAVTAKEVCAEWLYRTEGETEYMCFMRESPEPDTGKPQIKLGDIFGDERARVDFVAKGTRPEQLFLTEAEERNVTELKPLSVWFRNRLRIIAPDALYPSLALRAERNPEFLSFLVAHLKASGTGITGLVPRRSSADLSESDLNDMLKQLDKPSKLLYNHSSSGIFMRGKEEGSVDQVRLMTQRETSQGTAEFELTEESDGTRRLLELSPALFHSQDATTKQPPVFVIDELERSLHPLLTKRFLQDYLQMKCPGGQMIVTTHDTNLQDLALLRSDEIWFVEKDAAHASHLYSLAEFKPEQLEHLGDRLEDGYLNGRFGAIPFFGKPRQLGIPGK